MVLLHIISNDKEQASEIAYVLVEKKLVLAAVTFQEVSVKERASSGEVVTAPQVLIIARTKGILFNTIEACLRDTFPTNGPVLYSIPIVNMNWQEANVLITPEVKDL